MHAGGVFEGGARVTRDPRRRRARRRRQGLSLIVFAMALGAGAVSRGTVLESVYHVVPEQSRARITVGKSGVLSFVAGHTHIVDAPIRGTLTVNPARLESSSVAIEIDAASLRVTGEGEPPADVPKVQEKMAGPAVLDVGRYPTIAFTSTGVALRSRRGHAADVSVSGELTLHGVTRPMTAPVNVQFTATDLTATGSFTIQQRDYGIEPVSVGGVVSVRDRLEIRFAITAQTQP